MEDSDVVRADLRRLLKVIEVIREDYPRMELGQLAVLLHVLTEPGIWAKELTERVNLQRSALSRNVRALSQTSYLQDEEGSPREGYKLITQIPDIMDRRAMQLAPTRKGRTLAERLSKILHE